MITVTKDFEMLHHISFFTARGANEEHSDINDIRLHVVTIEMVPTAALAINRSFMCSPPCSKAHLSCFGYSLWLHLLLFFRNIDVTVLMNREYCPKFQSDPKPLKIRQTNTRLLAVLIYRFFLQQVRLNYQSKQIRGVLFYWYSFPMQLACKFKDYWSEAKKF